LARAKAGRATKQMLGQFMTPPDLAQQVTEASQLEWTKEMVVLEPGFGKGAFLFQAIEGLIKAHGSRSKKVLQYIFSNQIFGVEMDPELYDSTLAEIQEKYGPIEKHNLVNEDFFKTGYFNNFFDVIIGNPPYGGTFDPKIEDALDRQFGKWNGHNLKKETYSFFIAASLELLKDEGRLVFITSDTFLTINTMAGLRHRLMDQAKCRVTTLNYFSDETNQPVLVLDATRSSKTNEIEIENIRVTREEMEATGNFSWKVSTELAPYFSNKSLGDYIVCTSGMTIGNNELFVREIMSGHILEPYEFEFFDEPITLERELERARLNKLSATMQQRIRLQEKLGETRRNVRIVELKEPKKIKLPNKNYLFYNKAANGIVYKEPKFVVFWKDEGDAVLTFKKNGNWYLHGIGGQKFFKKQGMTWQLVAPRINMKFLPAGYILDSGAPCGFLRDGVEEDEFWFIFGWSITEKATEILKTVINHTRNIQSKDVERLPYPVWVSPAKKAKAIALTKKLVEEGMSGIEFTKSSKEIVELNKYYDLEKKIKK
jgi:tRNA1(Val) A37 N6-methylase TrmN6